jgi:hypothetical protein
MPASNPSVFKRCRVTALGMTRRSATWTPVALTPVMTARRMSWQAGGASRLVTIRAPRFSAVPSASPIRSAVSGVRSTLMSPAMPSRPKIVKPARDSQIRLRSTCVPDSTPL